VKRGKKEEQVQAKAPLAWKNDLYLACAGQSPTQGAVYQTSA